MAVKRAFISFDYDHDEELRNALVGQARYPNSPFSIADWSVKEPLSGDWKQKVRNRIRKTDLVIIICGEYTHTATGVADELAITREENKPYFLLEGRRKQNCTKPRNALASDNIYDWTWENLKSLIEGKSQVENALGLLACVGVGILGMAILSRWIEGRGNLGERSGPARFRAQHLEWTASGWKQQWL